MNDNSVSEDQGRASIITAVRTPLGFFALALLVGEACLLAFAARTEGTDRTIGIVGMILMLLLTCAAVYSLACRGSADNARFRTEIEGSWWEKINHPKGSRLSFFIVTSDLLTGNVVLDGTSYGDDGNPCATWQSEMTRLYPADRRISYLWRGKHPLPGFAHLKFHGYGTMEFQPPEGSSPQLTRGSGDFWDVDETQPGKTVFKPIELHRVLDENQKRIMTSGNTKEKQDLVLEAMKAW